MLLTMESIAGGAPPPGEYARDSEVEAAATRLLQARGLFVRPAEGAMERAALSAEEPDHKAAYAFGAKVNMWGERGHIPMGDPRRTPLVTTLLTGAVKPFPTAAKERTAGLARVAAAKASLEYKVTRALASQERSGQGQAEAGEEEEGEEEEEEAEGGSPPPQGCTVL
jgi:hypothetical protein